MSEFTLEPSTITPQREQAPHSPEPTQMLLTAASVLPFENLREIARDGLITLGRDGGSWSPGFGGFRPCHRGRLHGVLPVGSPLPPLRSLTLWAASCPPVWRLRPSRHHRHGGGVQGGFGLAPIRWRAPSLRAV